MNITITLTETEYKALQYAAFDPQDWAENAVHERCRIAIEEIVKITFDKCLENGIQIPGTKDDMVTLAFDQGWVQTAVDQQSSMEQTETP